MEVYIVHFETGEWDDHSEHIVGVFSSKEKADIYVSEKRKMLDELGVHADGNNSRSIEHNYRYSLLESHDLRIDYTGAWYSITGPYEVL
jgi:hypothetical protein